MDEFKIWALGDDSETKPLAGAVSVSFLFWLV